MYDKPLTPTQEALEMEALVEALESRGELFPTSEETLKVYEQYRKEAGINFTGALPDPMEIISHGRLPYAQVKEDDPAYNSPGGFNMAARNGLKDIPEHIIKKMEQLRRQNKDDHPLPRNETV